MPKTGAYLAPDVTSPIKDRIEALIADLTTDPSYSGFDKQTIQACKLISATPGTVTYELTVTPNLCNKGGNLHGGAAATIMDNLTSTALLTIAKPGHLDRGHVSRTLTTSYLRPVPAGTKVRVECRVVAAGRNTANAYGEIQTLDGKVCVSCVHDKVVFSAKL